MNWFRKKIKTKAEDLSSRKNGEGISILAADNASRAFDRTT